GESVILQAVGFPGWWVWLYIIPALNWIIVFRACLRLANSYDKHWSFGVLWFFLKYLAVMILIYGGAKYYGPEGRQEAALAPTLEMRGHRRGGTGQPKRSPVEAQDHAIRTGRPSRVGGGPRRSG
ncbi:MAG: DUF5684 domain-containing protein, partial [Candidatus Thorarchaeota archaeon]